MTLFLIIALSLPASFLAQATTTIDDQLKVINNVCNRSDKECAVTKVFFHHRPFSLIEEGEKYPFMGSIYHAGFETKKWSQISDYGFVQYIRGCTFESTIDQNGKIKRRLGEVIRHFGVRRTFVFPDWSFDTNDDDPIYYGPLAEDRNLPGGRLALYEWTPKIGDYDYKKVKQYHSVLKMSEAQRAKMQPRLMVKDTPSPAYYRSSSSAFNNVALEFKMCLYRFKDIPAQVTPDTVLAEPIICDEWESQFEFDYKTDKLTYSAKKGQHEFCATQTPMDPLEAYQREQEAGQE